MFSECFLFYFSSSEKYLLKHKKSLESSISGNIRNFFVAHFFFIVSRLGLSVSQVAVYYTTDSCSQKVLLNLKTAQFEYRY